MSLILEINESFYTLYSSLKMVDTSEAMEKGDLLYSEDTNDCDESVIMKKANKNFLCKICNKGCRDNYNLRVHEKTCEKRQIKSAKLSEPIDFEEYNEDFDLSSSLLEVDIDGKKVKKNCICQICNKGFRDTWKLKRHEKVHIKAGELPEPTYFSMQESIVNKVKETSDTNEDIDEKDVQLFDQSWSDSLKDLKQENPWDISSIFDLALFHCPECQFISQSKQDFIIHASSDHPWVSLHKNTLILDTTRK